VLLFQTVIGEPRWDDALANLRRAHELNPNDALTLLNLGYGEAFCGNPQQGIGYLTGWLRISPQDPLTYRAYSNLGIANFLARNYEETVKWALLANRDAPEYPFPYIHSALAYVGLAEIDKATAALDRLRRIAPEFIQARLKDPIRFRKHEDRERFTVFLRIAAGLEDPSAADALR
jgi:tetratricopeptide (TPR) repeat protein